MGKKEKIRTIRNVLITLSVCLFLFGGGIMMCINFPQQSTSTITAKSGMSVSELSDIPGHITENLTENFFIDADVKIGIDENFNIYTADLHRYDIDALTECFLPGLSIVNEQSDDFNTSLGRTAENGSYIYTDSYTTYSSFSFTTPGPRDKELTYYGLPSSLEPMRDTLFPKKDLDFMSCFDAVNIVKAAMENLGIPVRNYNVYPIDYDYIKMIDDRDLQLFGSEWYIEHTKDDEHYLIVMDISLPNNGILANLSYETNLTYITSGKVYAFVGKDGIFYFNCDGVFNITDQTENDYILSLDDALSALKGAYQGVKTDSGFNAYQIELVYLPHLKDADAGIFTLKPAWVFRIYEVSDDPLGNRYFFRIIDATTGEVFVAE